jgi:hypothetical protein
MIFWITENTKLLLTNVYNDWWDHFLFPLIFDAFKTDIWKAPKFNDLIRAAFHQYTTVKPPKHIQPCLLW